MFRSVRSLSHCFLEVFEHRVAALLYACIVGVTQAPGVESVVCRARP